MKRYRLLKDCPSYMFSLLSGLPSTISAGTIAEPYTSSAYFVGGFVMPKGFVENNPDWFEEVKEDFYPFTGLHRSLKVSKEEMGFPEKRRKAPAYVWNKENMSDWRYTGCFESESEAKVFLYKHPYDDLPFKYLGVQWPALPDKDGYYPGPK